MVAHPVFGGNRVKNILRQLFTSGLIQNPTYNPDYLSTIFFASREFQKKSLNQ